jgi:putative two-component system response regulator
VNPSPFPDPATESLPVGVVALSLAGLAIPAVAVPALPEEAARLVALLAWIPALLPGLLLARRRRWRKIAWALGGGAAALAAGQLAVLATGIGPPRWELVLVATTTLLTTCLGAGWLAGRLARERSLGARAALVDSLTGLPSRRHASLVLDHAWTRAARNGELAVVFFDVDDLRAVNDEQGAGEGDRVVTTLGRILQEGTGRLDLSARWGGEKFMTVLTGSTMDEAARFAETIRARFAAEDFGWGRMTASAGVSAMEEGMGSPEVLVAAADRALHQAKALGRDQVRRADQTLVGVPRSAGTNGSGPPARTGDGPISLEGVRVLLVDDDPAVLRSTGRLLERLGCTVRAVGDPREAVESLADELKPELVVTDIIMPEMSGFTLVDLASRVVPHLPALYMSGYPHEEVYWGRSPGARSLFLSKPLEAEQLESALRELLEPVEPTFALPSANGNEAHPPGSPAESDPAAPPNAHPVIGGEDATDRETATEEARRGARGPEEVGLTGRQGTILVLDDEPAVVESLQRIFRRAGWPEPLGLTDPVRLPGTLARKAVDLLLLDLHMPEMDGFQVLEELPRHMAEGEYLPVLVLTGDDDPEIRRRALAAGAHDFLRKPFDVAEAEARVQNLLETRRLTQRVARQRDEMEERVRERTAELADTRTEILHRLARAAEYRDDVTGRHAERVGLLSSLLASELGFPHREVDIIRRTAPLHDIGKIGIPDAVLRKPGRLTRSEFELMKTHTLIGEEILGGGRNQILKAAAEIALCHHEQWDGSGYPHGLTGNDIPISARLVALADTFDTLSHNRPYKNAHPIDEVIAEIRRCRGTQFDPRVVDAFEAICARVGPDRFTQLADPLEPQRDIYSYSVARR